MRRHYLALLLAAVLCVGLVTPGATQAGPPPVPLLLIHGQGTGPDLTWRITIERLQQKGYVPGVTLFAADLSDTGGEREAFGLLADAAVVMGEVRRIQTLTGAAQVDLVGHSRGGLIARLLSAGETAAVVRRAVSIDSPHAGAISPAVLQAILDEAGIAPDKRADFAIPADLVAGSGALRTLQARERHFAEGRAPALAVGAVWRENLPPVLAGHDGAVPLESQLAWPGAATLSFRLGPTAAELQAIRNTAWGALQLFWKSPHMQAVQSEEVLEAVLAFLQAPTPPPGARASSPPVCEGGPGIAGASPGATPGATLGRWLPARPAQPPHLQGRRSFDLDRPMTRAEFIYGLVRSLGLPERLSQPSFPDTAGHWALGYIEAARAAKLLGAAPGERFYPDQRVSPTQAANWLAAAKRWRMFSAHP